MSLRRDLSLFVGIILAVMLTVFCPLSAHLALSADLDAIKERGVLRHLGIPYANFVSESGKDGLDVEMIKLFAKELGVKYEYVRCSWEDVIPNLTGKRFSTTGESATIVGEAPIKGDIIANGFTILPLREQMVDYSIPTFPTQIWLIARSDSPLMPIKPTGNIDKDIESVRSLLKGQRLLGKENTCLDPALYGLQATGADIVLFKGNPEELVPAIIDGSADICLLDMPDALIGLDKWPGVIKVIGPLSHIQSMGCAFSKDSKNLQARFNEFFKRIVADGTYSQLVKKYYPSFSIYYPEYFRAH
jgi:ABC-type amino acid transport substrate-binding protein